MLATTNGEIKPIHLIEIWILLLVGCYLLGKYLDLRKGEIVTSVNCMAIPRQKNDVVTTSFLAQ